MIVGLDFGTTNSIIAYWDEKAQAPKVFALDSKVYIPSALAYEASSGKLVAAGEAALDAWENDPGSLELRRFFKPYLGQGRDKEAWAEKGWTHPQSPLQAAKDYISQILRESEGSFEKNHAKIENLIVSVPELWQKSASNDGVDQLGRILKVELQLPIDRFLSEPLAALAYYQWKAKLQPDDTRRVLVCDMGGGTFDVSFCEINSKGLKVLAFEGNDDNRAGVFELKEILRNVYRRSGKSIDENSFDFNRDLWRLDKQMQNDTNAQKLQASYENYARDKRRYGESEIFKLSGMSVTAADAFNAFERVKDGITKVLGKIAQTYSGSIPLDELLLVGGFSRYFLVRNTIVGYFSLKEDDEKVRLFSRDDSLYAIAYGAALVAAGQVEVKEVFPHTIVYIGYETSTGKKVEIRVVEAGQVLPNSGHSYARNEVIINAQEFELEGYVLPNGDINSKESFKSLVKRPFDVGSAGMYRVGIEIDRSNQAFLIISDRSMPKPYRVSMQELFKKGILVPQNS